MVQRLKNCKVRMQDTILNIHKIQSHGAVTLAKSLMSHKNSQITWSAYILSLLAAGNTFMNNNNKIIKDDVDNNIFTVIIYFFFSLLYPVS